MIKFRAFLGNGAVAQLLTKVSFSTSWNSQHIMFPKFRPPLNHIRRPTDVHERCGLNNKMPLLFLSLTAEIRFKIYGCSLESEYKDYLYILHRSLPWKGIKSDPRASPIQLLASMKTSKVVLH